jgi:hypothetical protein
MMQQAMAEPTPHSDGSPVIIRAVALLLKAWQRHQERYHASSPLAGRARVRGARYIFSPCIDTTFEAASLCYECCYRFVSFCESLCGITQYEGPASCRKALAV